MKLYEIIGIQHKRGTYQGQPFDNMVFSVTTPADASKEESGLIASQLKIKTTLLSQIPSIGDIVTPFYDRFGHVIAIQIN